MPALGNWVQWCLDLLPLPSWGSQPHQHPSLLGKVVLVTGASSGIGRELAIQMVKQGMKVILAARSTEKLVELRNNLINSDKKGMTMFDPQVLTLDLEDLENLKDKAEEALKIFGSIDILVNNGGMSVRGGTIETQLSVHQRLMNVNYFGSLELTRHVASHMVTAGSGKIVLVSSVQGRLATPYRTAYAASKHALQAWADCMRAELSGDGVEVLVVSPGYVSTDLSRNALTASGSSYGQLDKTTEQGYSVQYVAQQILEGIVKGKKELILAPLHVRLAIILRVLLPGVYFYIMKRRALKEMKTQ
eukprot:TRINITY_DN23155_c0_g1_i1.p1 TRINITY_DN23155_c0_g1~~TRINITY_DN23155_c0_g1_i1.p1  ORF type:complete len:304 (+),score=88.54 TRINITY_DN23155_c0_g1_i1:47-958(+)